MIKTTKQRGQSTEEKKDNHNGEMILDFIMVTRVALFFPVIFLPTGCQR